MIQKAKPISGLELGRYNMFSFKVRSSLIIIHVLVIFSLSVYLIAYKKSNGQPFMDWNLPLHCVLTVHHMFWNNGGLDKCMFYSHISK